MSAYLAEVPAIVAASERKAVLPRNLAKPEETSVYVAIRCAHEELDELAAAIRDNEPMEAIEDEAGDVLNFVAMAVRIARARRRMVTA